MKKKRFLPRSLVAFVVAWSFIVATLTGIVLYIVPHGRVAYWVDWRMLGLGKDGWGDIHIIFGVLFIVGGAFHLFFNWKPFRNYLADRVPGQFHLKREFVTASVLAGLVLASAVLEVPPVRWVFELNDWAKSAWVTSPEFEPPFGHAEELSLAAFARRQRMDLEAAMTELKAKGVRFDGPRDTLAEIASANHTNAMNLYMLIHQFEEKPAVIPATAFTPEAIEDRFAGTGLGRKSLEQVCGEIGVSLEQAHGRLQTAGVKATADETMRKIADRHDITPIDVLKHILIDGYKG